MKNGKILAKAIATLIWGSSGDTPVENYWVLTNIIDFINKETGSAFVDLDSEEATDENLNKINVVIAYLKSDECN